MSFPLPKTLSPSKVAAFKDCALAFRLSAIDKLPEGPAPAAVRGTLVHSALEHLFWDYPQGSRNPAHALLCLEVAINELQKEKEFQKLELDDAGVETMMSEARVLLDKYFTLEDPNTVNAIGMELLMETKIGDMRLRGIIDRLDLTENGDLIVIDYKTGKAPTEKYEQNKFGGMHVYSLLCERVLGVRPIEVRLLYLANPMTITSIPTAQSTRGLEGRVKALWSAIERACNQENFKPQPSFRCSWCSYKEYCPAFGGSPPETVFEPQE